jgi:hypothetical protein
MELTTSASAAIQSTIVRLKGARSACEKQCGLFCRRVVPASWQRRFVSRKKTAHKKTALSSLTAPTVPSSSVSTFDSRLSVHFVSLPVVPQKPKALTPAEKAPFV